MDQLAEKRALLLASRMQFAPETQSLRDAATERIVEQVLLLADPQTRLSIPQIEAALDEAMGGIGTARIGEVRRALTRLAQAQRVEGQGEGLEGRSYQLLPRSRGDLEATTRAAQSEFDRIVRELFRTAQGGPSRYSSAFLECLQLLFRHVADTYVRLITGEIREGEIFEQTALRETLQTVAERHPELEAAALERALHAFLTQSVPAYDTIKWNMTQNQYLLKALGLAEESLLLSKEVFNNAVLYLDTNVVLHTLEARARYHRNMLALGRACRHLNIELRVCQISLNELKGVVSYNRDLIEKVKDQIPEDLESRVGSHFYQAYREARAQDANATAATVFANFDSPASTLAETHEVELIDDNWFDTKRTDATVVALARQIQAEYKKTHIQGIKRDAAAVHDALLLLWIEVERTGEEKPVWLVTLDTSLPAFVPDSESGDKRPLAITLDALLQWIWPVAAQTGLDEDMSEVFGELLKYHLLPRETFLDLRDFEVLADFQLSCKDLPAEDVEECIRFIKAEGANLDLTTPVGREKLAYELARFFASPERKYKVALQELQRALGEKDEAMKELVDKHETEAAKLHEEMSSRIEGLKSDLESREEELNRSATQHDERIAQLEQDLKNRDKASKENELRISARVRFGLCVAGLLVAEAVSVLLLLLYASGANALQRILTGSFLIAVVFGLWLVITRMILGPERSQVLTWAIRQKLGARSNS
jgi:hypothetical protein